MTVERPPYKVTLFDRYGPDALHRLMAFGYGVMVFGLVFGVSAALIGGMSILWFLIAVAAGAGTTAFALALVGGAEATWNRLMASGASTPYVEQFSYQQALVMQGKVDEALASFEAVIAESPTQVSARVKAAELYLRDSRDVQRAFELLKQAQRVPGLPAGDDVYISNRMADLLTGPLGKPGAALIELRRLIERHPDLPAAALAREAIARIKRSLAQPDDAH
jgi:tetratricopeptide (TPR) repeat protein